MTTFLVPSAGSYDMGFGTRGTGRTYDSCTGHASMFGHESKKIIGFITKMRKCFECDCGHTPDVHNCMNIYAGTAKSMESAAAVELMSDQNESLKKANCHLGTFIGNGDNAALKTFVSLGCPPTVSL